MAALVVAFVSSVTLVFAVAWVRVSGQRPRLLSEANAFALSAQGLMAGALVNAAVLGGVAIVAAWAQGGRIAGRLALDRTRATPFGIVAAIAGMIGLSFASGAASELLGVRGGGVMDSMALALRAPSVGRFTMALLTIAVAPGLAEETLFRGAMQTRLVASWGRWPAIVATSMAFGVIHLDPVQGSLAFVAGLYLGWIVERVEGIRPTILAHIANNAMFVTSAALASADPGAPGPRVAAVVVGAAAWIASIVALRSARAVDVPRASIRVS